MQTREDGGGCDGVVIIAARLSNTHKIQVSKSSLARGLCDAPSPGGV